MAPSLSGLKLKMESESAIEVETEKIIILASEEKEVLPTHRLSFDPTIKERVLRRLSISDSKFDIPIRSKVAEESEEQPRLSGLDDASANTQLTEDVEDRETSLLVKKFLLNRVKNGKKNDDNNGDDEEEERHVSRVFQLAQFYFEEKKYRKALMYFNMIKEEDDQALFQIGVIMFDGLGVESDPVAGVKIMRRLAGIENNSETEAEEKANRLWNAKSNEEKKEKEKEMGKEKEYPNKDIAPLGPLPKRGKKKRRQKRKRWRKKRGLKMKMGKERKKRRKKKNKKEEEKRKEREKEKRQRGGEDLDRDT